MDKVKLDQYRRAAEKIVWDTEPCFYYHQDTGEFCMYSRLWKGHWSNDRPGTHLFVPLSALFSTHETKNINDTSQEKYSKDIDEYSKDIDEYSKDIDKIF